MIVLFSFNKPVGKFNYTWKGFTLGNWLHPFKYPALTDALKLSLNVAARSPPRWPWCWAPWWLSPWCGNASVASGPSTPSWCCR